MNRLLTTITLSLTLLTTFSFPVPTFASTNTSPTITRLAGQTRYETAAAIANSGWKQSDYAVLAYGENYPDALSATPLASKYNAPILLTTSNNLPIITKQTLINLQVKSVFIIGGTGVITTSVESELQSMGIKITRIAGQDRYETAIQVAKQIPNPTMLFVVTGEDYPDALSIAPIAAISQMPIILVPKDNIPDCVKDYIVSIKPGFRAYVVGDSEIINDIVLDQFHNAFFYPERIVGADRYERNIAINQRFDYCFKSDSVCLATGENFADALTGSLYAAKRNEPIILVNNTPQNITKNYYQQRLANLNTINVFGGTAVVSNSLIQDLETRLFYQTPSFNFKDKNLDNIIRRTINKSIGDLTLEDVQSIQYLYANNSQIKDLSGIENCKNLLALYLDNNQISDITALQGLTNLKVLHLDSNQIGDFSGVGYLSDWNLQDFSSDNNSYNGRLATGWTNNYNSMMFKIHNRVRTKGLSKFFIDNISVSVNQNQNYSLPSTVKAGIPTNSYYVAVNWNTSTVDTSKEGTYHFFGSVDGYVGYVILTLEVLGSDN